MLDNSSSEKCARSYLLCHYKANYASSNAKYIKFCFIPVRVLFLANRSNKSKQGIMRTLFFSFGKISFAQAIYIHVRKY